MNAALKYGQLVTERNGEVIFSMVIGKDAKPHQDLSRAIVIHPSIGVAMRKIKKGDGRPTVPQCILRLAKMVRAGLAVAAAGQDAPGLGLEPCVACGHRVAGDGDDERTLMLCCICMSSFHVGCAQAPASVQMPASVPLPECLAQLVVHKSPHVCELCMRWHSPN